MAENRELALVLKLVADQFQSELKKSGGMLGEFNKFVNDWKTQLAAAGGALFAIAKSTANYGEELVKTSQKVGVNIQSLAGLQYAATLAVLSNEQLAVGLKKLSVNMVEAATHTGNGEALFARLGVSATDATGKLRPTEQVLLDLADVFAQSKDGAGKAEVAVKLFGKAGLDLIPFLNQGKAGLTDLMAEASRLGLVMSNEDARAANQFNDELKKLTAGVRGMTFSVGKELIPAMTELMAGFQALTTTSAAQVFFKSLAAQAVLFSTMIKEAAANVEFLFGKFTFDQLRTEIQRLEAEGQAKLLLLKNPGVAEFLTKTPTQTKAAPAQTKEIALGFNPDVAARLTAQNALQAKAIQDRLALVQAGYDRERVMVESGITQGVTLEVEAAQQRMTIRRQELEAEGAALIAQKETEVRFHTDRMKLGFKDAADRLKVQTDYAQKLAEIDQKIALNATQTATASLQGQNAVDQATATATKRQLDLLVAGTTSMKADRQQQQQFQIDNAQAWVAYYEELDGHTEGFYARKTDLLKAQLAKELDLTKEQSAALLEAWRTHDRLQAEQILAQSPKSGTEKSTIELNTMRQDLASARQAHGSFLEGWSVGMRKYSQDMNTAFGMAADMARRTAQMMEQGFQQFFFDAFEGRITSLKDVLKSFGDFAKKLIAQVLAQLATVMAIKGLTAAFGGGVTTTTGPGIFGLPGGATGGLVVKRFAMGGPVPGVGMGDTVPALLTPGEFVVSRPDMDMLRQLNQKQGSSGGPQGDVTVNIIGSGQTEKPQVNVHRQLSAMVVDIIWTNVRQNGSLRSLFQS